MSPGQSKLPSDSIKVVPGRSKLRVESSNPVARGNPVPRPSKVKLITPEEAIKLHSGVSQVPVPPPSESSRPYKPAPPTFQSRLKPVPRAAFESQRPYRPARPPFESSRLKPVPAAFESQRREPVPPASFVSSSSFKPAHATFESQRPVPASPSALQSPSKVQQQATTDATTHTIEETVGDEAKDNSSKETCQEERISELLLYRPALLPTWKGRIVDSAMLFPEFDCQFWANPASSISRKALRLSKALPIFLDVELVPTGHILNDLFGRVPRLSDVELYFFSYEKETERSKREHAHLFDTMATRNAMIKASVNGAELLIFSSKLLDKTSQFFIKKQTKTENYLWGFFLHSKKYSQAHVRRTYYQAEKYLDDSNVVDMDIDPEDQTPQGLVDLLEKDRLAAIDKHLSALKYSHSEQL